MRVYISFIPDTNYLINKRRLTKIYKKPPMEVILVTSGAGTELSSRAVTAGNVGRLHHVSFVIISCRVTHSNI